ncbi:MULTISPECIES: CBU_0592 family membrane protein [unclassified Campylobacter]|uniref:CBU_0592 family membrane protein n=1 Tax=unclassified Campylobacter TaxID=2593542 RepID=UPI003D352FC8
MDIFQFIGFLGMICVVGGYFLLQVGQVNSDTMGFQLINLVGAVLLIISLCVHFNLGSFLIEIFWIGITIYGIYKILRKGKNNEN